MIIDGFRAEAKRNPQNWLAKVNLASALVRAGEVEEALILYQQVIDHDQSGFLAQVARNGLAALKHSSTVVHNGNGRPSAAIDPLAVVGATTPVLPLSPFAGRKRRNLLEGISQLQTTVQRFLAGDRTARAGGIADPQVAVLAQSFNALAEQINQLTAQLKSEEQQRQALLATQKQERSQMQESVINLLLDIEGAQRGDLTVRAMVDEGEMGSIADAFNATVRNLREIVLQVQSAANQVQASALSSETSVQNLSAEAKIQAQGLTAALASVEEMDESIQSVAQSAQEAADIARQSLVAAVNGGKTMDLTVESIENIRTSVADTSKKVKRLAESSQEISKIVSIISGISEKTNLLAFNASIEAARAGENGQGFRVVADEVRRLAERVTDSTKEIEQLVTGIQLETADVLKTMEGSTTQVVRGTRLVAKTKQTLQGLAQISQKIDALLQSISTSTVSQTEASRLVNQTMEEVADIAQTTSSESEAVSQSLQSLVTVAEQLQSSVSRFRVSK